MSNVYWQRDPVECWSFVRWSVYRDDVLVAYVVLDNATTHDPHPYSARTVDGAPRGVHALLGDALAAALK